MQKNTQPESRTVKQGILFVYIFMENNKILEYFFKKQAW